MNTSKKLLIIGLFLIGFMGMAQNPHTKTGLKKVIVQEVLQVESYTYLNVLEDGVKKWLAVPSMEANLGEVYYYKGGMEMPDFKSNELDRTFDVVIFLGSITNADAIDPEKGMVDPNAVINEPAANAKQPTLDKLELTIEAVDGGIRIADLFENKQNFEGKKIKVNGEITKFSSGIMGKNWVHFQDGTSFEGSYDLMITCQENALVGDVVVFEGVIALDKDFGGGYFYKVIMEDATVVK
ncbi:MAG: hypothetical protein P1P79_09685 [Lutibacter sp.]|nr:hypothetical protein [Lutibacter sp.]